MKPTKTESLTIRFYLRNAKEKFNLEQYDLSLDYLESARLFTKEMLNKYNKKNE